MVLTWFPMGLACFLVVSDVLNIIPDGSRMVPDGSSMIPGGS